MEKLEQKDSKYYTPDLSEFHVGFEYEYKLDEWKPFKYQEDFEDPDYNELYFIKYKLDEGFIRVKYLDCQDIEELGFTNIDDQGIAENNGYLFKKPSKSFQHNHINLRYWYNSNRVQIIDSGIILFNGHIKNKSELIVLLKQLGIE